MRHVTVAAADRHESKEDMLDAVEVLYRTHASPLDFVWSHFAICIKLTVFLPCVLPPSLPSVCRPLPPPHLPQQSVEKYFTEITDTVRVLDELQSNLAMAKEFEMVLAETGKLLKHRSASNLHSHCLFSQMNRAHNSSFCDEFAPDPSPFLLHNVSDSSVNVSSIPPSRLAQTRLPFRIHALSYPVPPLSPARTDLAQSELVANESAEAARGRSSTTAEIAEEFSRNVFGSDVESIQLNGRVVSNDPTYAYTPLSLSICSRVFYFHSHTCISAATVLNILL